MSTATESCVGPVARELEYATFRVGDLLVGVDIQQVQEINRHLEGTTVPHAPECVRGVLNLRGDVVTVLDLRTILDLESGEVTGQTRNVVLTGADEKIGLVVDSVAEVVYARANELYPPPANVRGVDGRFIESICKLDNELLVILNISEVLACEDEAFRSGSQNHGG